MTNKSALNANFPSSSANCGTSAHHAFSGDGKDLVKCPWGGESNYIDLNYDPDDGSYTPPNGAKGDVIRYIGQVNHVETLTGSGSGTWGANTASQGTNNWTTTSINEYIEKFGPSGLHRDFVIMHYPKP